MSRVSDRFVDVISGYSIFIIYVAQVTFECSNNLSISSTTSSTQHRRQAALAPSVSVICKPDMFSAWSHYY